MVTSCTHSLGVLVVNLTDENTWSLVSERSKDSVGKLNCLHFAEWSLALWLGCQLLQTPPPQVQSALQPPAFPGVVSSSRPRLPRCSQHLQAPPSQVWSASLGPAFPGVVSNSKLRPIPCFILPMPCNSLSFSLLCLLCLSLCVSNSVSLSLSLSLFPKTLEKEHFNHGGEANPVRKSYRQNFPAQPD